MEQETHWQVPAGDQLVTLCNDLNTQLQSRAQTDTDNLPEPKREIQKTKSEKTLSSSCHGLGQVRATGRLALAFFFTNMVRYGSG